MTRPIVLCTDFGPASPYVGQLKLVLETMAPGVRVIDLAHDITPHSPMAAALVLSGSRPILPPTTVLCVIVDPEVGSARKILAAEIPRGIRIVVPDNGIATVFPDLIALHEVTNAALFREQVSPVFHGRDIFAPVAAALASGCPLTDVGPAVEVSSLQPLPRRLRASPDLAEVIYVDVFGNLITNLHREDIGADLLGVTIGGQQAQFITHYAKAPTGALLCLVGSYDRLEVAVRNGSATEILALGPGARFNLERAIHLSDARTK